MSGLPDFTFAELPGTENRPLEESQVPVIPQEQEETKEEAQEPEIKQDLEFDAKIQVPEEEGEETVGDERLTSLYNFWREEGLLNHEGEFKGTSEEFAEILKQQRIAEQEAIQEGIISAMPEYAQNLVEYILTEGDQLSIDKLQDYLGVASKAQSLPEIDSEEKAKSYLLDKYAKLHGDAVIAEKLVEALEDDGALTQRANSELEKDKVQVAETEKKKLQESKAQKATRLQAQQQFQASLAEELKKTGWKPEIQQEVYNEIFGQGLRAKTAGLTKYPKALLKVANYMRYFDPETGDIDENAFASTAFSSAAKDLKAKIEKHFGKSGGFGGNRVEEKKKPSANVEYEFVD